jgi:hypothetical protein
VVPPYDTAVSGLAWIAVMHPIIDESTLVVVPGHGDIGGPHLLAAVPDYLEQLREETWRRRDARMTEQAIAEQVWAVMTQRHPDWAQPESIERGVDALYTEHAS